MKRFLKRLCILVVAGALLAIVGVVIALFNLDSIADKLITNQLEAMGFKGASLHVESASLGEIEILGLDLGHDTEVAADRLHATYSLLSLWNSEVETVRIDGLRWDIRVYPDRTDFGLGVIPPASDGPIEIPFQSLTISNSTINLIDPDDQATSQSPAHSNFNATITRVDKSKVAGDFSMQPFGASVTAAFTGDLAQQTFNSDFELKDVSFGNLPIEFYEMLGIDPSMAADLVMTNASLFLPLQIGVVDEVIKVGLTQPATLSADEIVFGEYSVDEVLALQIDANDDAISFPLSSSESIEPVTSAAFGIHAAQPVSFQAAGVSAHVPSLAVDVEFDKAPGRLPSLYARLSVDGATANISNADLAMQSISADVPIFFNRDPDEHQTTGSLAVQSTTWQSQQLPPLRLLLNAANNEVEAKGEVQVHEEHNLEIIAGVDYYDKKLSGEFVAYQPPAVFEDFNAFGLLGNDEDAWTINGVLALNSRFLYQDGALNSALRFFLSDATISDSTDTYSLSHVSGSFALDSISPLQTPGLQYLEFGGGKLGETATIENGRLAVSIEKGNTFRVEELAVNFVDAGSFVLTPFAVDPNDLTIATKINATGANLSFWLPLLTRERATGEGTVDGFVDVVLRPAHESRPIQIRDGRLLANPSTGWLIVNDASQLEQMLVDTDPRFANDETMIQVKDRIINAMMNFAYDTLQMRFEADGSDTIARIHVSGRGRQGRDPQEITLDLNISGLQDAAAAVIPLSPIADLFGKEK